MSRDTMVNSCEWGHEQRQGMWETEKGQSKGDVNVGKKVAPLSGGEKGFPPVAEGYQVAGGERQKQASFLSVATAVDMSVVW